MIQPGQNLRFAPEPGDAVGVASNLGWQDLERDVAAERRVARAIDLAHSSLAQLVQNAIWAEVLADHRRQNPNRSLAVALT